MQKIENKHNTAPASRIYIVLYWVWIASVSSGEFVSLWRYDVIHAHVPRSWMEHKNVQKEFMRA